jgi:two-component system chemotaxis response regulator CheB
MTADASRPARDVVVIAASAGGLEPLSALLAAQPRDLPAGVAIVIHRNRFLEGQLLPVLQRRSPLPVIEPTTGTPFEPRMAYLAPRDHHLTLEDGVFHLDRGPELHHFRPAADVLFTAAAQAYGPRVVGIVLSGAGFDGARGCLAIKAAGGTVLVQKPGEADFPYVPQLAIGMDHVDAVLPLGEIAAAIPALATGEAP